LQSIQKQIYIIMATKITSVNVPGKGTGEYLDLTVLSFSLFPSSVSLYWAIKAESTSTNSEGEEVVSVGATLTEGNLSVPEAIVSTWGTDDSVIADWAIEELGLEKA
jgi:uncharacterized protein YycO